MSTFLVQYQQCVQPWKQQWLSWQPPADLPAALQNKVVPYFNLQAQSERGKKCRISNQRPTASAKQTSSVKARLILVEEGPHKRKVYFTIGHDKMGSKSCSEIFSSSI